MPELLSASDFFASSQPTEAKLGDQNAFYYDEDSKQWRERGVEAAPASGPPPPPPRTAPQSAGSAELSPGFNSFLSFIRICCSLLVCCTVGELNLQVFRV